MNEQAFRALIDLVQFDQSIQETRKKIELLQAEIGELHSQEQEMFQQVQTAKQDMIDARKVVDEFELELQDLDVKEQKTKARLDTVANQKEFQALQAEIAKLKESQHNLENALLTAWNKRETAERGFATIQTDLESKISEVQKKIAEKNEQVQLLETETAERIKERASKLVHVPEEWLATYATMGTRVENPVVPVINGSCSGCFYQLTSQDLLRLKRGALLQCKHCFRFLYAPEAME